MKNKPPNGAQIHARAVNNCIMHLERACLQAYLDFTNDYLTIEKFAEHHFPTTFEDNEAVGTSLARQLVAQGERQWDQAVEQLTRQHQTLMERKQDNGNV